MKSADLVRRHRSRLNSAETMRTPNPGKVIKLQPRPDGTLAGEFTATASQFLLGRNTP